MKIRFVHQYFFPDRSSVSQVISQIAFDLAGKGNHVSVICSRNKYDDGQRGTLPCREVVKGVEVRRCWGPSFGRGSLFGRVLDMGSFCLIAAFRLLLAPKADTVVFLTNPPMFSLVGVAVKRIRKERFVFVLMDVYPDVAIREGIVKEGGVAEAVLRRISAISMREADRIVVLGDDMRQVAIRSGAPPEKVNIIRNWADPTAIYPVSSENNRLRKDWGLDGKFVVEYSGNLGVSHFFNDVLVVAQRLVPFENIRFVFIGGGPRYKDVERFVQEKKLPNVILKPYVDEKILSESLSVGDVHFVSLRPGFEGLVVPSKAYGIMAAGRPIIYQGEPGGEIARMIAREGIGYIIPPGDGDRLYDCILSLYQDRNGCARMGSAARRVLIEKYSAASGLAEYRRVLTGYR